MSNSISAEVWLDERRWDALEAVLEELARRSQKIGNLKQMKSVDRET